MKTKFLLPIIFSPFVVFSQQEFSEGFSLKKTHQTNAESKSSQSGTNTISSTLSFGNVRALAELNDAANADAYPWISADGLKLYYTSGANNNELMVAERPSLNSNFSAPSLMYTPTPHSISFEGTHQYWLTNDELDLYATTPGSNKIYHSHRNSTGTAFSMIDSLTLTTPGMNFPEQIWNVSLDQSGNLLYVAYLDGANYRGIMEFVRTSPLNYELTAEIPMPTGFIIKSGQVSKDALSIFFSASDNGANFKIYQMSRAAVNSSFDINTLAEVVDVNDQIEINAQPSLSLDMQCMVFVRNATDWWDANELYLAQSVDESSSVVGLTNTYESKVIDIFPNPSKAKFAVRGVESGMEVYNILGDKIGNYPLGVNEIDLTGKPKGIYFVKFLNDKKESITKKIILD